MKNVNYGKAVVASTIFLSFLFSAPALCMQGSVKPKAGEFDRIAYAETESYIRYQGTTTSYILNCTFIKNDGVYSCDHRLRGMEAAGRYAMVELNAAESEQQFKELHEIYQRTLAENKGD